MKRMAAVIAVALFAATAASAQPEGEEQDLGPDGVYVDTIGDAAPAYDVSRLSWRLDEASVTLTLVDGLDNGSAVTAILYVGTEGDAEPDQAFIMHHGPGGDRLLLAQNSTAPGMEVRSGNRTVTFDMDGSLNGECVFAVARTVSYPEGGQQVEDMVGWTGPHIEDAWNEGVACTAGTDLDALDGLDDAAVAIPALALPFLVASLAVLTWVRRTQRP